jgi:hypothetical protein
MSMDLLEYLQEGHAASAFTAQDMPEIRQVSNTNWGGFFERGGGIFPNSTKPD